MADPAQQYLIAPAQGDDTDPILMQVREHLAQDPDASIVKDRSEYLVAAMSDEAVDRLRSAFETKLMIEPDSQLKY